MTLTASLPVSAMSSSELERALLDAQQQNAQLLTRVAESKTIQERQARRLQALAQIQSQNYVLQRQAAAAGRALQKARFENAQLTRRLELVQAGETDPELERLATLLQQEQAKVRHLQEQAAQAAAEPATAAPAEVRAPRAKTAKPQTAKATQQETEDQQAEALTPISTPKCLGCGKKMAPDYARRTGRAWHGPCERLVPADVLAGGEGR